MKRWFSEKVGAAALVMLFVIYLAALAADIFDLSGPSRVSEYPDDMDIGPQRVPE